MGDNTTINNMSGGDSIATDDIGGVKFQRVKVVLGADGVNDGDLSSANPLPVTGPLTDVELRASDVPVTLGGESVAISNFPATQPVSIATMPSTPVTGPLTDAELRAADVPVTLGGESVPVTGTFWQATQPVSGPLTDVELRASDVPVTLGGESVAISNFPATQPVSIATMPATPVTGPLTDAELRAADVKVTLDGESVPVTGTFWQATQPVSGPITDVQLRAANVGVTDADLYAMLERLLVVMQGLQYPPWLDRSANAIRNQVQSGTVTTVTTVTTVSAMTSLNSYNANQLVQQNNVTAWALACRARIT